MSPLLSTFAGAGVRPFGWGGGNTVLPAFELISTQVLASSAASLTFSLSAGQQSTYKHLQLRVVSAADTGTASQLFTLNGDSATNYARHGLVGAAGSNFTTFGNASTAQMQGSGWFTGIGINQFFGSITDFLDAFSTTKSKTMRHVGGGAWTATYREVGFYSGIWNNTAAITSITIAPGAGNWVTGSRFSLYGVRG